MAYFASAGTIMMRHLRMIPTQALRNLLWRWA